MKNQDSGNTKRNLEKFQEVENDDWFFNCPSFRGADECSGGI